MAMEPEGPSSPLWARLADGGGLHHVAFRVDDLEAYASLPGARRTSGPLGTSVLVALHSTPILVEFVDEHWPIGSRTTPIERIESIAWAVRDADAVATELVTRFGLELDERYSHLWFPELGVHNRLLLAGLDCYVDLNLPARADSPVARQLARTGDGIFAVILEPADLDLATRDLRARGVPTLVDEPVRLRVEWRDGSEGIAARVLAVDRRFTLGARVFLSEPTFPW